MKSFASSFVITTFSFGLVVSGHPERRDDLLVRVDDEQRIAVVRITPILPFGTHP